MKRELGGFTDRAAENKKRCDREKPRVQDEMSLVGPRQKGVHFREVQGPQRRKEREESEEKSDVPDACGKEGFQRGVRGGILLKIKTDQKVRAKPHDLPGHEKEEVVVRDDEREHGEHEKRNVREEPAVARVAAHVTRGVDLDQGADDRDHEKERRGKRVHQISEFERRAS